jgi:signal recognition particle subunit SRP54
MFKDFSSKLISVLGKLKSKSVITEEDLNTALREVRIALLEADVALSVVKEFINSIKTKALGQEVNKNIIPAHAVIKLVQDELELLLGGASEVEDINLSHQIPNVIMMVGLQGSGKTTSSAKLAMWVKKQGKKVLLVSLDVYRPAAKEQLKILAEKIGISFFTIFESNDAIKICKEALKKAKEELFDAVILDTAGRLHIDETLMEELEKIKSLSNPQEILLVVDAMLGQDGVNVAKEFNSKLNLTGSIITRIDGDARGGVALSIKMVAGVPIKFMGVGEKIENFEKFHPKRIASRILEMGDIVSLVEKAQEVINEEEAEKLEKKLMRGEFTLDDLAKQIKNISKIGGLSSIVNFLPGAGKIKELMNQNKVDDSFVSKQIAIINSMTKKEKQRPDIINGSRKIRIANGSGTNVQDVNKLLKQFYEMQNMMRKLKNMDKGSIKKMMQGGGLEGML